MIKRTLIINQEEVHQDKILEFDGPIIILGEPGIGKSVLCEELSLTKGNVLIKAGKLNRSADPAAIIDASKRIVIDGLDEVTSAVPGDAVDKTLEKLSILKNPQFILSCRVADWHGATYRHKITEDYEVEPLVFQLSPLTEYEAQTLLKSEFPKIDADAVIQTLQNKGVSEIYGNPLTLKLLGEAVQDSGAIPNTRAEILKLSCYAMVKEINPAHQASVTATAHPEKLLNSAGAISATLLLTGKSGIYSGSYNDTPNEYIHMEDIASLPYLEAIDETIKTRLFRGDGENCLVPIHRVVSEYLGARWMSLCLKEASSPRRILQMIHFRGGVPTSLRGLNAWMPHFNDTITPSVIEADPYGVLRYGDSDELSLANTKVLLNALVKLSKEDPYFRSEDRSNHSARALARPELKDKIVEILKNPNRPFHLSTLILNSIAGSQLAPEISTELKSIMMDEELYYGERSDAAESLRKSNIAINWLSCIETLLQRGSENSARLATRVLIDHEAKEIPVRVILDVILQDTELSVSHIRDKNQRRVSRLSSAELVPKSLPTTILPELMDVFTEFAKLLFPKAGWESKSACTRTMASAINLIFEGNIDIAPERIWSWIKNLDNEYPSSNGTERSLQKYFSKETELRRAIQKIALSDKGVGTNAWMRAHTLGDTGCGIYPTIDDFSALLDELNYTSDWTEEKIELWKDLLRLVRTTDGLPKQIQKVVKPAIMSNEHLKSFYDDALKTPVPEWKIKQEKRQKKNEREQKKRFKKHRAEYLADIEKMRKGQTSILYNPARAYSGRFSDLNAEYTPSERLKEWLGSELAEAARDGFIAALSNDDLPSAQDISKSHAENKFYYAEKVMQCGIAEMLHRGQDISQLPKDTLMATLVSWQQFPEQDSKALKVDIGASIEPVILTDEKAIEDFLTSLLTPQVESKSEHISGLYKAARDEKRKGILVKLAKSWLQKIDDLPFTIECTLVDIILNHGTSDTIRGLLKSKLKQKGKTKDQRKLYLSVAFIFDFASVRTQLEKISAKDKGVLWWLRNRLSSSNYNLSVEQCAFIINNFGDVWPSVDHPGTSSGDNNPHNATDFIRGMIQSLSEIPTDEAAAVLVELSKYGPKTYRDYMLHSASQQKKLLRDELYTPPTFQGIAASVNSETPTNIDDLKAYTLDKLDDLEGYLRGSDVDSLDIFFANAVQKLKKGEKAARLKPHDENYCRNRLIDFMRPMFLNEIQLLPETQMANLKRVDINVINATMGIPIEIKGQWHKEVWNAPNAQLDEFYTRDWRADGRGVYLVLWFGNIPHSNLPKHPDGLDKPKTPDELKEMLIDRIPSERRSFIDVFVLDLSR